MSVDVAVAGIGLTTPFGRGVDPFWSGLCAGRSELVGEPGTFAAEPVGRVPASVLPADGTGRKAALLRLAVADALADAGLAALPPDAFVVVVGQSPATRPGVPPDAAELADPGSGLPASAVHLSHACASALFGLALARDALRSGIASTALVAGANALNRYEYASMTAVRAVSAAPARPMDVGRTGISVGEGAGALVLRAVPAAAPAPAGAPPLLLSGAACRVTGALPAASDEGAVLDCMRDALRQSGRPRPDYVHAHATGTSQGDAVELAAIDSLAAETGTDRLPVSSHKGAIGHLLHTSGFAGVAAAARTLESGTVPPTPGLREPESTGRAVLAEAAQQPGPFSCALVNGFGFGGNNACVALSYRTAA